MTLAALIHGCVEADRNDLMKRTLIRYKTKPERAEENMRLTERVFQELHAKSPEGIRYLALKLGDGTFVHLKIDTAEIADPIHELEGFRAFQQGIKERCLEVPQASEAVVVGDYRMLGSEE
jgi:hypothetical protein